MNKNIILSTALIGIVISFSNKIGKDFWNSKIICNKLNIHK